jgi:hypothetical protein
LIVLIALDGWSNPRNNSLWNFVILTSDHKEHLYKIKDLSSFNHTGEYLSEQILYILEEIGINKFVAIVSDGGPNVRKAREIVNNDFPFILNIRCVAHCLNLITKDIVAHDFPKKIIKYCKILTKFFKKSHRSGELLNQLIEEKNIEGGGPKTLVKTRWISTYECLASVLRLRPCLEEVNNIL